MKDVAYSAFKSALDLLIYSNFENRKNKNILNPTNTIRYRYFREMCTIFCNSGRSIGKTRYILENFDSESILIVGSDKIYHIMIKEFRNLDLPEDNILLFKSQYDTTLFLEKFININNVYIDEPYMLKSKESLDIIQECFLKFNNQDKLIFICLGEV